MGCPGAARTAGLWLAEQPRADLGTWGTPAELRAGHRVQEENRTKSEQGRCFSRISGLAASHISVQPKGKCPNHEQRAPTTTLLSACPHHHFRPHCHLAGDNLPASAFTSVPAKPGLGWKSSQLLLFPELWVRPASRTTPCLLHQGLQLHPEHKAPTAGEPARPSRILFPCRGSGSVPSTSYLQGVGHRAPLDGLAVSRAVNHDEPHSCCHCCDQHGLNHLEAGPVDVPAKGEHHTGFSSSPIALRNT